MALALAADVSTRHISYLETAKAAPSRDMALRLAEALSVPAHARNDWLTAAGFAPIYESRPLDSAELAPFMHAVTRLLDRHDPYPGWALDPDWRIVLCNHVGERLLRRVGIAPGDSLVAALVGDPTLGGALLNWREATLPLAQRLGAEARRRNDAGTARAAVTGSPEPQPISMTEPPAGSDAAHWRMIASPVVEPDRAATNASATAS